MIRANAVVSSVPAEAQPASKRGHMADGKGFRPARRCGSTYANRPLAQGRLLAPAGASLTDLAAQLGHAKKSLTLDTYSHVLVD